jgi:hypothetical protein
VSEQAFEEWKKQVGRRWYIGHKEENIAELAWQAAYREGWEAAKGATCVAIEHHYQNSNMTAAERRSLLDAVSALEPE